MSRYLAAERERVDPREHLVVDRPAPRTHGRSRIEDLDETIERGVDWLLSRQSPEGWWWAELESNATITAEHLFLTH
ncbi:squalene--hopene cyclase, partial [Candidatus Acetothermia bacterium]